MIQLNYRSGVANYLELLIADVQENQATIARIGGQAERLQDTVALFIALGGGWWEATGASRGATTSHDSAG